MSSPQDILNAIRANDPEIRFWKTVVEFQNRINEVQRETIEFQKDSIETLKKISSIKDALITELARRLEIPAPLLDQDSFDC